MRPAPRQCCAWGAAWIMAVVLAGHPLPAFAHGGGLNPEGCHVDNRDRSLHCHSRGGQHNVYEAVIIRVLDGDSMEVKVRLWQKLTIDTIVRLHGIDAPEISSPACPREREQGMVAKKALETLVAGGVILRKLRDDKYSGRVVADVYDMDERSISSMLLGMGLVKNYSGKGPRPNWCI